MLQVLEDQQVDQALQGPQDQEAEQVLEDQQVDQALQGP